MRVVPNPIDHPTPDVMPISAAGTPIINPVPMKLP